MSVGCSQSQITTSGLETAVFELELAAHDSDPRSLMIRAGLCYCCPGIAWLLLVRSNWFQCGVLKGRSLPSREVSDAGSRYFAAEANCCYFNVFPVITFR